MSEEEPSEPYSIGERPNETWHPKNDGPTVWKLHARRRITVDLWVKTPLGGEGWRGPQSHVYSTTMSPPYTSALEGLMRYDSVEIKQEAKLSVSCAAGKTPNIRDWHRSMVWMPQVIGGEVAWESTEYEWTQEYPPVGNS